jgi:chromosome segregation ATPase
MGRINKRTEALLKAATDVVQTTKNVTVKAQMIKVALEHDLYQQKRADARKLARHKRTEDKELAELVSKVQQLTNELASEKESAQKAISDLQQKLSAEQKTVSKLEQALAAANKEKENVEKDAQNKQARLAFANRIIKQFAPALPTEKLHECAAELFVELEADQPEVLAALFESMGLDVSKWRAWDTQYAEDAASMVKAFEQTERGEPEKLTLLRRKLVAIEIPVDEINAVRDYRDLKISLTELKERAAGRISVTKRFASWAVFHSIPDQLMPVLTGAELTEAVRKMKKDPAQRLEWLEVTQKLLKPESTEVSLNLAREISSALYAAREIPV